jgi:hypothetical protein
MERIAEDWLSLAAMAEAQDALEASLFRRSEG